MGAGGGGGLFGRRSDGEDEEVEIGLRSTCVGGRGEELFERGVVGGEEERGAACEREAGREEGR